ncbi:MAG TPA: Hpt domain-containing protein, partial [Xanthomonadales bacterium]|nr:Hpt domain-containing protein [Xanthomonadales bacterium]
MMLEGTNASTAIRWVRQDLDDALQSVRDNLEAFSADKTRREPLQVVQEQLEQLNLTFLTMAQKGASILTDEMIAVGGHMLHSGESNADESLAALTDAIIVLPSYLDRLQAGHDDLPILLLPTLNELRATYDETLLSEGTLFAPQLDVMIPELSGNESAAVSISDFPAFSRRVRNQYQMALLGWLNEQSKTALLEPLEAVCNTLQTRLGRNDLRRLWWIAEMTIAGFHAGAVDNDLPLRRLFARLDLTLKSMTEGGPKGPSADAVTALSRALLFHAAQAKPGSKPIDLLRKRFKLDELIPDREALLRARGAVTGRDAGLFASIGDAIREEMGMVKDTLDMELRTGRVEKEQRDKSMESLRQLADTLNMLNLPVPARAVEELLPGLEQTEGVDNSELNSPLLKLARKLIEVESVLDTHIRLLGEPVEEIKHSGYIELPAHEQRLILSSLLDECVVSLQEVQDGVRKYLAGDTGAEFDGPLEAISGALTLAGQGEVAALTEKMGRALHAGIQAKADGASDKDAGLIPLADSVAALELYLAGCRDEQSNSLRFLEIMHERLDGLPEASASGEVLDGTDITLPEREVPAVETPAPAAGAAAAIDPDMLAIFLEEFDTVGKQLQTQFPAWLEDTANQKTLTEVKRGFHTLKGSGRMVGAMEIGDFAWRIENVLNSVAEQRLEADDTVTTLVRVAINVLPELRNRLLDESSNLDSATVNAIGAFGQKLAAGDQPDLEPMLSTLPEALVTQAVQLVADTPEEPTEVVAEEAAETTIETGPVDEAAQQPAVDPELAGLMLTEVRQYTDELAAFLGSDGQVTRELVRSVHTLAGTLAMSPLGQEANVARALEHYFEALDKDQGMLTNPARSAIELCVHRFRQRQYILEHGNATTYPLEDEELLAELAALTADVGKVRIEEALVGQTDEDIPVEETQPSEAKSRASEFDPVEAPEAPAAAEPPRDAQQIEDGGILAIFLEEATEVLERCDTLLNTWRDKLSDQKLVQNLQREIHTFKGGARMAGLDALGDLSHAMETLLERIAANRLQATIAAVQVLEEGCDRLTLWVEDLLDGRTPEAGESLSRFEQKAKALSLLPAGKEQTADERKTDKARPPEKKATEASESEAAETEEAAETTEAAEAAEAAAAEAAAEQAAAELVAAKAERAAKKAAEAEAESSKTPAAAKDPAEPAPAPKATAVAPKREFHEVQDQPAVDTADDSGGQQHIRVAAELMDSLVNYAGEISIYRARLEQQLGTVRFNLKEVGQTVGRLKEQLRKMEGETEAQMLSRYQSASTKGSSEFDPLELDRFSNMQQLARALTESVSDLVNLQDMLEDSVRQAESLLVQQSRVSSDLQEGLMQTRMTPFGSAAPRLRRVVRAAATETGKRARLQLKMAGSSDQLDRNVLERITAPLEHMLRNSVVHGIESPKERRKADKPEEGEITVTVEAEATEFVVRVEDDGNGVNLNAVRKRAIERGMLGKDEDISDSRLVNFILESGFSTAETVTGLAGRGVGMDVVNNEIKQIGGSMEIDSEPGKGSCFTLRIPFSLAVMQAIGVSVGNRPFLVPLNSVAGVARMLPADYTALKNSDSPVYEFASESFPVLELDPLLGEPPIPLDSENVSLLMIRSGEHKAAFRVAELQGHQEVVIKPVGPQVSSIPGILGATISGDGQVVLILDMGPVIRRGLAAAEQPELLVEPVVEEEKRTPLVMVVDDSITMRKVTSRVLENHALEVMTAQDGLD